MGSVVLIVDDEESIRLSLRGILEDEGHEVREAGDGETALAQLDQGAPDMIFLDIWLPGMDGLEVLDRLREQRPDTPIIMISGHGSIETAVTALKKGAFDFIEKPLSLEKVVATTRNALEFARLQQENRALKTRLGTEQVLQLTGESALIRALRETIFQVAPTDTWILITGENGTGKEIVALMLHRHSRRADKPMVAVNCAAIPEELIEAELFGHEKGAFTGAEQARTGKFELAHRGTLFLDEIGDMSLKTQAKILRILQEQRFEHVGSRKTIQVDVRVIAATNKDLPAEIEAGRFRQDLYYRLKVMPLEIPPLRARGGQDIRLLIDEFINALARQHGFRPIRFAPDALDILTRYPWPGNVRELKNFVERMLILHAGGEVTALALPPEIRDSARLASPTARPPAPTAGSGTLPEETVGGKFPVPEGPLDLRQAKADFEARFLEARLRECEGNVARLAKSVGMERSSLYRKLKQYGLQTE